MIGSWIVLAWVLISLGQALNRSDDALTGDISGVVAALEQMSVYAYGFVGLALVSIILVLLVVLKGKVRTRFAFRLCLVSSVNALLAAPLGTLLGICGLVHLVAKRKEY